MVDVLMLSTDRLIFQKDSHVRRRMVEYGNLFRQLKIVVLTFKGYKSEQLSNNVWVHPTNSWSRWFYLFDAYRLAKKIIKNSIMTSDNTVVTSQDPFETGLVGRWLSKKYRFGLHLQIHVDFMSPFFKTGLLNRIRLLIAKFTISQAKRLRVVSRRIKTSLVNDWKIEPSKIDVLPIFIEPKSAKNNSVSVEPSVFLPMVLMVSRLEAEKNLSQALRVFAGVLARYPRAGLVVVGDGRERENLELLVKKLNLSKQVRFVGWQNNPTVFYSQADIFLFTSKYEGYGMALIEAGQNECAILSTDVGVVGEVLEADRDMLVCQVDDSSCLAEKLDRLLSDAVLRETLAKNAKLAVTRHQLSKSKYLEDQQQSLESVLNN